MEHSPNKFDRTVAILIQLQSKKVVRAQDLADRFGVSLRTIYRDIRTLEASGVPLFGEAGTGYSLVDGYRLPPVMFTREEAASFIAAEKLMAQLTDTELGQHYESAMFKLKAVLRSDDKELISDVGKQVLVRQRPALSQTAVPNALAQLFRSIGERKQAVLLYAAAQADEALERRVEPVGVYHENQFWYVLAFCHLRHDYRQFRTDRIQDMRLTDVAFTREHEPLEHYLSASETSAQLTEIVIRCSREIARYLSYDRHHFGFTSEKPVGDLVEMTFLSRNPNEGFARWFLQFADCATVVRPEGMRVRIGELLRAGLKLNEKS